MRATDELKRNAKLISPYTNNIGYAVAIFEPAPLKSSGTALGVTVQLVTTFLYMANYNLVIPTVDNFMDHLKVCCRRTSRAPHPHAFALFCCSAVAVERTRIQKRRTAGTANNGWPHDRVR